MVYNEERKGGPGNGAYGMEVNGKRVSNLNNYNDRIQ